MIRVTVLYPNEAGKRFDMDYYCNKHIPMVKEKLGEALKGGSVERGLAGTEPGSPAAYLVISQLYFDSMEDCLACMGPNAESFSRDVPNFTDIKPTLQVSEVVI